ncbi:MAG TPA: DUF5668 domain-containing protein [Thermoanaerobaculia bacterium]|jgi:hypothetical protein|nr:DUF5668 domain-containing protein [Thermoanaerobaculia bacterium]
MNRRRINADGLFWGLLLIGGGTLLLLQRFHVADFSWNLGSWWPLFIVLVGMSKLAHRRSIWSGLWVIALGAWLQAVNLHWYGLTYNSSWPLLLVILGAGMIGRTIIESFRRRDAVEGERHHE